MAQKYSTISMVEKSKYPVEKTLIMMYKPFLEKRKHIY
jgi:hypothetical protein